MQFQSDPCSFKHPQGPYAVCSQCNQVEKKNREFEEYLIRFEEFRYQTPRRTQGLEKISAVTFALQKQVACDSTLEHYS